jgi:hypothetical protein
VIIIELERCKVPACVEAGQTTHRWEFERPTIRELLRIQEALGLDPDEWEASLNEAAAKLTANSMRASLMLVNVLHRRIGIPCTYEETDFDIFDLQFLPDPAAEAEVEAGGKEPIPISPLPEADAPTNSTSGRSPKAGSGRRSSATPPNSGGASASP